MTDYQTYSDTFEKLLEDITQIQYERRVLKDALTAVVNGLEKNKNNGTVVLIMDEKGKKALEKAVKTVL